MPKSNDTNANANEKADSKADSKNVVKDGAGNVLAPGTVVPHPQDTELAEKGIFQPAETASNGPKKEQGTVEHDEEAQKAHDEHAANLRAFPPVPAESAGSASQAK